MTPGRGRGRAEESARVGGVRPSQLMFTYGVGSLADLPNMTVLIGGLDRWTRQRLPIREPRLLEAVQVLLGRQVQRLEAAPLLEDTGNPFDDWAKEGVPAFPFPRWLRCSNPACNLLATVDTGLFKYEGNSFAPNRAQFVHQGCAGGNSKRTALPVRFVLACPSGHLDDFPWVEFCHDYTRCPGDPVLELRDVGLAARATDQKVRCRTCGADNGLQRAFGFGARHVMPQCRGRHPHLPGFDAECRHQAMAMIVGATNLWFPLTRNALSLPDVKAPVDVAVAEHWGDLAQVDSAGELATARKYNAALAAALAGFSDDDVFAAVVRYRDGADAEVEADLFGPEWRVFTGPPLDLDDLATRRAGVPDRQAGRLAETVAADRLRTVTAFCGFTRVDSLDDVDVMEMRIRRVPICLGTPTWVPAAEARGEGLLVRLDEDAVQAWETRVKDHPRLLELQNSVAAWRVRRNLPADRGLPTPRFVLVHTFAHLILHQVALDCGYMVASLQERVYARDPAAGDPMAGVLVFTAEADSEGTLGGLVALGDAASLGRLVTEGLHRASLCSGDPHCSEHRADDSQGTSLHGASCHSCLFLPETSCNHGNRSLDRAVLVPTLAVEDLAFFDWP